MNIILTDEQLEIINSQSNRIMVNAGPGSGKTATLSCYAMKQANRINDNGKVLVVSLTNYAANNALKACFKLIKNEDIKKCIGPICKDILLKIEFSTIHSLSFRMLRRYSQAGVSHYMVVDNEMDEEIIKDIVRDVRPKWLDKVHMMSTLLNVYALSINGKSVKGVMEKKYPKYLRHANTFNKILCQLKDKKSEGNIISFKDMVDRFNDLLDNEDIRQKIMRQYPVVVVDEYQDTGDVQWKIIKKLVGPKTKLLCAGDDGQTIFTWADASFKRFNNYQQRFPKSICLNLTLNHRSTKQIMNLSNAIMTQSKFSNQKQMTSKKDDPKPIVMCNEDPTTLFKYMVNQINKTIHNGGSLDNIVVLYRFYDEMVYNLKGYLEQSKIPYKVFGDKIKRDRPMINLIFSMIEMIESSKVQRKHWEPVLLNIEGIGKRKVDHIIEWIRENPNDTKYPKDLKFTKPLDQLLGFVQAMKSSSEDNVDELKKIIDFIEQLPKTNRSITEHIKPTLFKLAHESATLSQIVDKYNDRCYPLYYPGVYEPPYPDSYLSLSTVHRIKGGEFNKVFYLGTSNDYYEKYGLFKDGKSKEMELQLMNVAISRASQELHLLFPINMKTWNKNKKAVNSWKFIRAIKDKYYTVSSV